MIEIKGDFWKLKEQLRPDYIVFTSNKVVTKGGRLVMGGGIAKDFRDRYKGLDKKAGENLTEYPDAHIMTFWDDNEGIMIVAFPTKNDWKKPSIISYIEQGCKELLEILDDDDYPEQKVLMTRPGCGLGGLDWETQVKSICEAYLDDRFYVCYQ